MTICFTHPLCYGTDRLHMAPLTPHLLPPRQQGLSYRTYNIRDGQGFGLSQAIWEVHINNFNVMLPTQTNITSEAYFRNRLGYIMMCLPAVTTYTGRVQGGVCLLVRERPQGWGVELAHFHSMGTVSCEVVSGSKRNLIFGAYPPPPSTLYHLPNMEEALTHFWDQDPIVLGDLNAKIGQAHKPFSQQVSDLLIEFRLVDLLRNFHQHLRLLHLKTWSQFTQGILMQARCNYIFGTYQQLFETVGI